MNEIHNNINKVCKCGAICDKPYLLNPFNLNEGQIRFRLCGVPPEQAVKIIKINPSGKTNEIKKLIFKGKVIPDNLQFTKLEISSKKDVISVKFIQGGDFL